MLPGEKLQSQLNMRIFLSGNKNYRNRGCLSLFETKFGSSKKLGFRSSRMRISNTQEKIRLAYLEHIQKQFITNVVCIVFIVRTTAGQKIPSHKRKMKCCCSFDYHERVNREHIEFFVILLK